MEAEVHLNILTGPAGRLCFLHSPHTGISLGIFAQSGRSKRLSLSLLETKNRRDICFVRGFNTPSSKNPCFSVTRVFKELVLGQNT